MECVHSAPVLVCFLCHPLYAYYNKVRLSELIKQAVMEYQNSYLAPQRASCYQSTICASFCNNLQSAILAGEVFKTFWKIDQTFERLTKTFDRLTRGK